MFGGSGEVKDAFVEGFKKDLYRVAKALKTRIKAYDNVGRLLRRIFPNMPSENKEEISNPTAKDLSYINSRLESAFVVFARDWLRDDEGFEVGALVYDGLLVHKKSKTWRSTFKAETVLPRLSDALNDQFGWKLQWAEKSMDLTDKDWEWFDYPALRRRIEHPDERDESSQSQEPAPKPVVPKPSPTRIARKLSDKDGNLHFTNAALQQEQLEPKEDDGPTVALKRIVLQAAQEQKLFRVYGGNGVFAESQRLPKRLEPKFNTIFDFVNSVAHDKPQVIEADLEKIAADLRIKAVAPGVFPFMQLGDSVSGGMQVDFLRLSQTQRVGRSWMGSLTSRS